MENIMKIEYEESGSKKVAIYNKTQLSEEDARKLITTGMCEHDLRMICMRKSKFDKIFEIVNEGE